MSNDFLVLKNVTKAFGKSVVIDDLDLNIKRGTMVTLLGPSGCGKTTVLRLVAGLESPTSGQIFIDGEDVTTIWLGRDDNGETKLTGASGALQVYKAYLQRAAIRPLKLNKPQNIKWIGINAYGGWDCSSSRTIPVWADRNQSFCQQSPLAQTGSMISNTATQAPTTPVKQESVWDVLKEGE